MNHKATYFTSYYYATSSSFLYVYSAAHQGMTKSNDEKRALVASPEARMYLLISIHP